jgi:hypothetical protein
MRVNEVARLESDLAMSKSECESLRVYVERMADEITELNNDLTSKGQEYAETTAALRKEISELTASKR